MSLQQESNFGKTLTASILTIGTEVCDGEILNTNARWLAEKLSEHQIQPVRHLTVPDDEERMKEALSQCLDSDVIVTTGGLGPTKDDFTTQVVAEWAGLPLKFSDQSWSRIQTELIARGLKVFENHRSQCFFPEGSEVLLNRVGTADAFHLSSFPSGHLKIANSKNLFVLPGPPSEIAGLYEDHLKSRWTELAQKADSKVDLLRVWLCLGISESEMADRLDKIPGFSSFRVGFRPHVPYITFKLWAPSEQSLSVIEPLIENELAPWLVNRTDDDPLEGWIRHYISDATEVLLLGEDWSKGRLTGRILATLKNDKADLMCVKSRLGFDDAVRKFKEHDKDMRTWVGLRMHRDGARERSWFLEVHGPDGHIRTELDGPRYFSEKNFERMISFAIEKSLVQMLPSEERRLRPRVGGKYEK